MKCSAEHRPSRPLINFAHSGFVNDLSWDDEEKPLASSMSRLCRGRPEKEAGEMAIRMDHALRKSSDFPSLTLRMKPVDKRFI